MKPWIPDTALLALALASVSIAAVRWQRAEVQSVIDISLSDQIIDASPRPVPDSVAAVAAEITQRNPFRLSNRPATLRHGEQPVVGTPAGPKYRPSLALKAIVGGPPWNALIEGIPGVAGPRIVAPGERLDSIDVRRITSDSVVLRGPDTTWVLTVGRRP